MAILSTNQKLIKVDVDYSAGNGIDITSGVISVTGDNAPYSAGQNIYFDGDDNHVINGKDWGNEINDASANAYNVTTAWVQDNYANSADMTYISAMVDTKLDTSAWSSVSGDLATESYVIMADNITYDRAKGYVDSKGFATEEFVNESTSGKLDSSSFDTWQQGQYTNDIAGLNNLIGTKLDASSFEETSGNFYTNDNPSGFITGVDLSNYYTKDETSGKEELADAFANIPVGDPEVNAYVTSNSASIDESTNLVQSNSSTWNDVTAYQSNSANYITAHQSLEGLMSASLLESADGKWTAYNSIPFKAGDEFPASADEAIITYQTNSGLYLTAHQDISNKLDVSAFSVVSGTFLTGVDLTPYYTTADANTLSSMLSGAIDYVSANAGGTSLTGDAQGAVDNVYTNSGKYVLNNANGVYIGNDNTATLNGFAQGGYNKAESYAFAQGLYNKANGYSIVQGQFCTASNESIAQGVGNSADNYSQAFGNHTKANNSGMTIGTYNNISTAAFVIGNGSASTARSDCFIIDHNGNVSACGKISANGVELGAGGGGNPEVENYVQTNSGTIDDTVTSFQTNSSTYMVEPNLEYNAVNEISGYNGSAIAQYGAEKQWLQHDDTLVHAANSAQYALGVNLSAVAQLLGVDETLLWSGDAYNNITASEPLTGFKRVRLKVSNNVDSILEYGSVAEYREIDPMTLDHDFTIAVMSNNGKNSVNKFLIVNTEFSATNNFTEINSLHTYQVYNSSGTWSTGTNNTIRIKEIVGIGRKS